MTIEYNWNVVQLEYTNNEDKGVTTVHYTVDATDGIESVSAYGSTSHQPNPTGEGYLSLGELSEEVVLGWVWEQIDQAKVEEQLAEALELKANPPVVAGLPWATPQETEETGE